jgi:signal transduction histidine kinase
MLEGRNLRSSLAAVPRRVLAGFAIAILTLLIVSAVTLAGLSRRTADSESVRHTFLVLRTTQDLIVDVSDSQLALTEFISTGDPALLAPYETARASVPRTLEQLRALTVQRPEAQALLRETEPLLREALERDALEIEARRSGLSIEQLRPMLLESKVVLDKAMDRLDAFKDDIALVLAAEQESLQASIRRSMLIVVGGDVVLLALIATAAGLALRDAAEKARAVQFQRRVLGIVGHDLRNPLSVVMISASQLAKSAELAGRRTSPVSRILAASNRMEKMIRDLLDYSRIELRIALPLDIRPANAHESCARIVEEFRAVNPGREIRYEPGDDAEVRWDPDRIEQVLANLVANALKYGQEGTPVCVAWRREHDSIVLEVHNQGTPIPQAMLPHIFEPFRRAASGDARTAKASMGLGLYIVRQIVEQHGGSIDVRSSSSEGTTFTVQLPASTPEHFRTGVIRRSRGEAVPGTR